MKPPIFETLTIFIGVSSNSLSISI